MGDTDIDILENFLTISQGNNSKAGSVRRRKRYFVAPQSEQDAVRTTDHEQRQEDVHQQPVASSSNTFCQRPSSSESTMGQRYIEPNCTTTASTVDQLEDHSPRTPAVAVLEGATHPSFVADSHFGEQSTLETYEQYYSNREHIYSELPIKEHRENIVSTIESNSVTVIQGSTGSGKTTQVPQYILDRCHAEGQHCNIIVTQPRRIAAMSVAERICAERQWRVGGLVGYQVAMNRVTTEDTRLLFVTTGVLLEKLIKAKNMNQYTHIILDEVHERDEDIDFAMLVVRKLLRTNSKHVKVILMSATIDSKLFADYFAYELLGQLQSAPVLSVGGCMFTVKEHYLDGLKGLMTGSNPAMDIEEQDSPRVLPSTRQLCAALIKSFDRHERPLTDCEVGQFPKDRGTVLVFLPGMPDINDMAHLLEDQASRDRLDILPLHSKVQFDDQRAVFCPPQPHVRKVILATNIAESSITVPDVRYVIDFCLVKHLVCDMHTNYESLQLCWASKAALTQRKGRAGRVQDGVCFRLISKAFYEGNIADYAVPEMQRQSLEQLVLRVKMLDLGDPRTILNQALSPPASKALCATILLLKEVGALSIKQRGLPEMYDGELTFVGHIMANLPVDVRIAKMLVLSHVFGCLAECLVIAAALSLRSIFTSEHGERQLKCFKNKLMWANGSQSDPLAVLNAYMEWRSLRDTRNFRGGEKGQREWGRNNGLQIKRMKDLDLLVEELQQRLQQFNIFVTGSLLEKARRGLSADDQVIIKMVLAGAFYPNYFTMDGREEEIARKEMSGHNRNTTVVVHNMPETAPAYRSELAAIFRECGRVKNVHHESSRAYIEFEETKTASFSEVSTPVLLALKMRTLRIPLVLTVTFERDESFRRALTQADSDFLGNPEPVKPLPQIDFSSQEQVEIHVTEVMNAGHFWAQCADRTYARARKGVQEYLETHRNELIALQQPAPGCVCVALYDDEKFYRACINSVDEERQLAQLTYLDYGNIAAVPFDQLREMPESLKKTPQQAFQCRLAAVRPSVLDSGSNDRWSVHADQFFWDCTCDMKRLWACIYSVVDDVLNIDLMDTTGTQDVCINNLLVERGYAEKCDETRVSRMAHRQRQQKSTGCSASYQTMQYGSGFGDISQFSHGGGRNHINLKGPFSSYEQRFHALTSLQREARVERDSVNSVVIDSGAGQFKKMLVGATVGITPTGSNIVIRESTVMPSVPGLPGLVALLFSPVAELRADKSRHHYSGALCGLGPHPNTGAALYADHDMEIVFDTHITRNDFEEVLKIRQGINLALSNRDGLVLWNEARMMGMQKKERELMLGLLRKERYTLEEEANVHSAHRWNQVKQANLLKPHQLITNVDELSSELDFFSLHCGVKLVEREVPIPDHIRMLREQIHKLYQSAERSNEQLEQYCPLCNFTSQTPRHMLLHLNTRTHREQEQPLFSDDGFKKFL